MTDFQFKVGRDPAQEFLGWVCVDGLEELPRQQVEKAIRQIALLFNLQVVSSSVGVPLPMKLENNSDAFELMVLYVLVRKFAIGHRKVAPVKLAHNIPDWLIQKASSPGVKYKELLTIQANLLGYANMAVRKLGWPRHLPGWINAAIAAAWTALN